MPRSLGVLIIAGAAALAGVYAWFGFVRLVSAAAKLTHAHAFTIAMVLLSPHVAGWLVVLALAVALFVLGLRFARRRRIAWLGFPDVATGARSADASTSPPSSPGR